MTILYHCFRKNDNSDIGKVTSHSVSILCGVILWTDDKP